MISVFERNSRNIGIFKIGHECSVSTDTHSHPRVRHLTHTQLCVHCIFQTLFIRSEDILLICDGLQFMSAGKSAKDNDRR